MKAAIIGAGFAGLAAANKLNQAGYKVTVFEQAEKAGGLAGGFRKKGWDASLEYYYHHWFTSDDAVKKLVHEFSLAGNLIKRRPKTVMYHEGGFYPLDSPITALSFPGFSKLDLVRFGVATANIKLRSDWQALEKVTAKGWLKKWYGEKLYRILWEPLLIGKFGDYADQVNMAFMWARLKSRTTWLLTYRGGFQQLVDELVDRLAGKGVEFQFNTRIEAIKQREGKVELSTGNKKQVFDQVLVTLAPAVVAKLTPELPVSYTRKLTKLKSLGAAVVIFRLKQGLSPQGYYWYSLPKNQGFPFLSLVEHTNFVDPSDFNGEHLVYCGDYLPPDDPAFEETEDELAERYAAALPKFNPDFKPGWIKEAMVFRTRYAQPVPLVDHSKAIPKIRTPIKGLFTASMSQVYPWDRGTNYAIMLGDEAAGEMVEAKDEK